MRPKPLIYVDVCEGWVEVVEKTSQGHDDPEASAAAAVPKGWEL